MIKFVLDKAAVDALLPEGSEQRLELEGIAYEKVAEELFRKIRVQLNDKVVADIARKVREEVNNSYVSAYRFPKQAKDAIDAAVKATFTSVIADITRSVQQDARRAADQQMQLNEQAMNKRFSDWWEKQNVALIALVRASARTEFVDVMKEVRGA